MKRISCLLLAASIWSLNGVLPPTNIQVLAELTGGIAQTQDNSDLFYLYKGQRISLNQRPDAIPRSGCQGHRSCFQKSWWYS